MVSRGLGLIAYGVEGIGKTSFCLQFPKPLRCISVRESGFLDLQDVGDVPPDCEGVTIDSWADLLSEISQSTDVRTVVIDSLSGVMQLMKTDIIEKIYREADNPMQSFGSFSEGWRIHAPIWMEKIENQAERLRVRGINVLLIGHTKIEKSKNVISTDYQSAMLQMEAWPRDVITKWAQAVLFLTLDFKVKTTKKWKGVATEAKVDESFDDPVDRVIYTEKHPSHSAKNRLKLPACISMGMSSEDAYDNFLTALPENFQEFLSQKSD